ncbi:predicted protein [Postia placenta Mad-698-R]|uniref:Uncharacterized protein n=1 Tax=Postia placenta MAD-698-R-SB12 TaxID=670580 RepID=A0A1X6MTZ5_9APHY|nr:hypothetical protein POSPLADRAFT_1149097 [Postia placenta MAD-698-R-SB12]EED86076.1 predicted protein [Postia placenta Mad-698-R]OSX59861.1 hypothetical protein POSPLADRAFT_1149097 [Postia placenta MAD-698-R-SB12]
MRHHTAHRPCGIWQAYLGRPSRRWDPAHSLDVSREHHRQAQKTQVGRVTGGTGHQRNGGMREHRAAWLRVPHGRRRRTKCRAACRSAMTGMRDRDVHKNIARRWFEAASGRGVMCGRPVHISTAIRRHGLCQKCHGVHGSEEQSIAWTHAITGTHGPTRLAARGQMRPAAAGGVVLPRLGAEHADPAEETVPCTRDLRTQDGVCWWWDDGGRPITLLLGRLFLLGAAAFADPEAAGRDEDGPRRTCLQRWSRPSTSRATSQRAAANASMKAYVGVRSARLALCERRRGPWWGDGSPAGVRGESAETAGRGQSSEEAPKWGKANERSCARNSPSGARERAVLRAIARNRPR